MTKYKIAGWLITLSVLAFAADRVLTGADDEQPKASKSKKAADKPVDKTDPAKDENPKPSKAKKSEDKPDPASDEKPKTPKSNKPADDAAKPGPVGKGIKLAKTVKLSGRPVGVFVEGERLYVAAEEEKKIVLHIFDIKDAKDPKPLGKAAVSEGVLIPTEFIEGSLFVRDGLACIAQSKPNQMTVVDVSDPAKPAFLSKFTTHGPASQVYLTPKRIALITCWGVKPDKSGAPLHVVDLKEPKKPAKIADVPPPIGTYGSGKRAPERYGSSVIAVGDIAYAMWWIHGIMQAFDISDPAKVKGLGEYRTTRNGGWGYRIVVSGKHAFLSTDQFGTRVGGIHAMDVSDPAKPKFLSYFSANNYGGGARKWTRNLALSGSSLYLTDYGHGVAKIDVSNPKAMKKLGELTVTDARGIASGPGAVYLAAKPGILVLDAK